MIVVAANTKPAISFADIFMKTHLYVVYESWIGWVYIMMIVFITQTKPFNVGSKNKIFSQFRLGLNPFSTNVPLMDKPGCWFLLAKCLKNSGGRVPF